MSTTRPPLPWVRINPWRMWGGAAGIFTPTLEWRINGLDPVRDFGLVSAAEFATERGGIPHVTGGLYLNLLQRGEAQLVATHSSDTGLIVDHEVMGATFNEEHPDNWVSALVARDAGVLCVGPTDPSEHDTITGWLSTLSVGVIPLLAHLDDDGFHYVPTTPS